MLYQNQKIILIHFKSTSPLHIIWKLLVFYIYMWLERVTWNGLTVDDQRFSSMKNSRIKWLIYLRRFQSFGKFKILKFQRPASRFQHSGFRVQRLESKVQLLEWVQRPESSSNTCVLSTGIPVCQFWPFIVFLGLFSQKTLSLKTLILLFLVNICWVFKNLTIYSSIIDHDL